MGRYVIERGLPGAGQLTEEQLHDISSASNAVLANMSNIEWIESYVTDDKIYCVYEADNPELILEHAREGGFPADSIAPVRSRISPATGA